MDNQKKLYRSRKDQMLAGVASGVGEYLEIDPTIVRVIFVLLFFASGGLALFIYIILAVVVPLVPKDNMSLEVKETSTEENEEGYTKVISNNALLWVIVAILILVFFNSMSPHHHFFSFFNFQWLPIWSLILIIIGLYFILKMPNVLGDKIDKELKEEDSKEVAEENTKDNQPGRLISGVIIVVLGMLLLARSLGWLAFDMGAIWSFWPVVLIFFGLSLLSPWRSVTWIGAIILLVVIIWAVVTGFAINERSTEVQSINIEQAEDIDSAVVNIKSGAGKLTVLGGSEELVSGSLESSFLDLNTNSNVRNNVQNINIHGTGSWNWLRGGRGVNEMIIQLNEEIPLEVNVSTGAMDMNLDLKDVTTTAVEVDTGASNLVLDLGDKAESNEVTINAGASSIRISLPRTVGARVSIDSGLSAVNLQDFNRVESRIYESDNYSEADSIVNIQVNMGVSNFDVVWR